MTRMTKPIHPTPKLPDRRDCVRVTILIPRVLRHLLDEDMAATDASLSAVIEGRLVHSYTTDAVKAVADASEKVA